jgi:hypothetical protein
MFIWDLAGWRLDEGEGWEATGVYGGFHDDRQRAGWSVARSVKILVAFATSSSNVFFVGAIAESIPFAPAWLLE